MGPSSSAPKEMHTVDGWEDNLSCGSDIDGEVPDDLRRVAEVEEPSKEQMVQHELENHANYRAWCPACVAGRGVGSQHRRKKRDQAEAFRDGPCIYSDYFFMSTQEEGSTPMLVLKFSRSGRISATALPAKAMTDYGVKFFRNFILSTGIRRFVNFSDSENAMVSLKEAAAKLCEGVESVSRNCPVGDHRANGHAESSVKQVKGQMRSIRLSLEQKLGIKLAEDHPLLQWIPMFAGDAISRHRRGPDGKTPYERELQRKWTRPALEFGEKIFLKEAKELSGRPKRDWEGCMIEARFIGHHARSNAVMAY